MIVDIPTAVSLREVEILKKIAEGKKVLEVGSLLGFSTVHIASKAREVISIDPHENYPYEGAPSTLDKFRRNLFRYGIQNVEIIKDTFQHRPLPEAEVCFADLDGTYETTKNLLNWAEDIPTIIIHDFNRQNCAGVERALKEFTDNIQVVDTCAILRRNQ